MAKKFVATKTYTYMKCPKCKATDRTCKICKGTGAIPIIK